MASIAYEREISGGAVFDGELRTVTNSASKVIRFARQSSYLTLYVLPY